VIHIDSIVDPAELQQGLKDGLIVCRESGDGQYILNYTDRAMHTGSWANKAVRACRGLIFNADRFVVARPWEKFFNYGEGLAGDLPLDAPVEVTDKIDGSLGILHLGEDGDLRIASRGSFHSDQAQHATHILHSRYPDIAYHFNPRETTVLFEIVYPANRIVCDYGTQDDLILLGSVDIESGEYFGPDYTAAAIHWSGPKTDTFRYETLREALAAPERPGAEGLVVRFLGDNHLVKIKQADYLKLFRITFGLSERTVWEHLMGGGIILNLLDQLPEELHPWVRAVSGRLHGEAFAIWDAVDTIHQDILYALPANFTRKEYAAYANKTKYAHFLFQMLDDRDMYPIIMKSLKPGHNHARTSQSEDAA